MLDATVGGASANSYVSVAEADAYFATLIPPQVWPLSDATKKEQSLIRATQLLDRLMLWTKGSRSTSLQALEWPRTGCVDRRGTWVNETTLPTELQEAACELAERLLSPQMGGQSDAGSVQGEPPPAPSSTWPFTMEILLLIQHLGAVPRPQRLTRV